MHGSGRGRKCDLHSRAGAATPAQCDASFVMARSATLMLWLASYIQLCLLAS